MLAAIDQLNWGIVILACATLGLAPYFPPHVFEKLSLLFRGALVKPLDWFDLFFHGLPWIVLLLKCALWVAHKR